MCHNRAILKDVQLAFDGSLAELTRLAAEVQSFCAEHSLAPEIEFDLVLALEELFTNAVRHGGCEGMRGAIEIRLARAADGVMLDFRDRGRPFNPLAVPAPDFDIPLADRPVGGLGIHLVREIMRDLRYERVGEWNRLSMRRPLGGGTTCSG